MGAQVGDIGTKIRFNVQEDISGASVLKLKYRKPNSSAGEWEASVYNSTYAEYTTGSATDFDIGGVWSIQVYVEMPGWKGHSEIKEFLVAPNIPSTS
jgi:hypothetical protein